MDRSEGELSGDLGRRAAPRSAQRTRLWGLLLALPTAWMVTFFVSSMVIVVLLSFGRTTNDGFPVFATSTDNYRALWNEVYLELFVRSLVYALATVVISVLIAYPVAYAIALHGGRYKNALIAAIVVPFFASYLIRMYAWKALLSDDGLVNSGLRGSGLSDGITFLNTPYGGHRRPGLRLRGLHDPADLRVPRAARRVAHRGRQGPLPRPGAHVLQRDPARHPRRPVRRHACWSSCPRSATSSARSCWAAPAPT